MQLASDFLAANSIQKAFLSFMLDAPFILTLKVLLTIAVLHRPEQSAGEYVINN